MAGGGEIRRKTLHGGWGFGLRDDVLFWARERWGQGGGTM